MPIQVALQNKWAILAFAAAMAALAYAVLATFVRPLYTAEASVMIDARQIQLMGAQEGLLANQTVDENWTRTQMEVLRSPRLAEGVTQTLDLGHNEAFEDCGGTGALQDRVHALLSRGTWKQSCTPSQDLATKVLLGSVMGFSNDRQSYIIKVAASVPDPVLAARIANAYATAFVDWQREMNRTIAERADALLTPYLEEMRSRAAAANATAERFRQTHNLVQLRRDGDNPSQGQTLRSQSLDAANSELSTVTSQLAEKRSVVQQVQNLLSNGGRIEAISPVLASPIIQGLLARRASLYGAVDELRTRFGSSHPQVAAAQAQLARNEQQISFETAKTLASLSSEVGALVTRKALLVAEVESLQGNVAEESRDDVTLRELNRAARAESSVYEAMLVRLKQIGAERLVQRGQAQVVVEATPPEYPFFPKKRMMVTGTFLASLGIGAGFAFARSLFSRRFRSAEQIEDETGLLVLGLFPATRGSRPQDVVIDAPLSLEADNIHSVLAQVCGPRVSNGEQHGRVVLVTSALPGEGKTSFSVALGRSAIQSGLSTFVLDCDLRRPALERAIFGRDAEALGGMDAKPLGPAELMARAEIDTRSGLRFLSLSRYISNPRGILSWPGLPELVAQLRGRYNLIILDTPPVLAVSDVLQLGPLTDQVLLMINWHETPRSAVTTAMQALQRSGMPATGAVMSKVNLHRYARANPRNMPYLTHYRSYHQPLAIT